MYCIYTGKEFKEDEMSVEHIIPLSLGGCDDFTIMVEKGINSDLGNEIDGKLAEDFLVKIKRARENIKGHSRKTVKLDVRGRVDGRPVTYTVTQKDTMFYDHISRKRLTGKFAMQMSVKFNLALRLRFVCKVALATGYFLYGEKFVKYADCTSLRQTMLSEEREGFSDKLRYYDTFIKPKDNDAAMMGAYKYLLKCLGKSTVIFSYHANGIIVFVSVNGDYIGSVNVKADMNSLITEDDSTLGRVLLCSNNIRLYELRDIMTKFFNALNNMNLEKEA